MQFNKVFLALFLGIVLLAAGCTLKLPTGGKGSGDVTKEDDFSGTTGLKIAFMEERPPDEIFKDSPFEIGLKVENKGAFDVYEGAVCFGSLSENMFSRSDACLPIGELKGRKSYPGGGSEEYVETGFNFKLDYNLDSAYPITAKVCYSYKMDTPIEVCLKSLEADIENKCKAGNLKLPLSTQGGPIQVVSVKETVLPTEEQNELMFTIMLKNAGDGKIVEHNAISSSSCPNPNDYKIKNRVKVSLKLPGSYGEAKCGNDNLAIFDERGNAQVKCRGIFYEKDKSYPLQASLQLLFGYISENEKKFILKAKTENIV